VGEVESFQDSKGKFHDYDYRKKNTTLDRTLTDKGERTSLGGRAGTQWGHVFAKKEVKGALLIERNREKGEVY